MRLHYLKKTYLFSLTVTIAVSAFSYLLGGQAWLDAVWFDKLAWPRARYNPTSHMVVMTTVDSSSQEALRTELFRAVMLAAELKARAIVINFNPGQALLEAVLRGVPGTPPMVVGVDLRYDAGLRTFHGKDFVDIVATETIKVAGVYPPPADGGVRRRQARSYETTWGKIPALEWAAVQAVTEPAGEVPPSEIDSEYYVDFSGPADTIPRLSKEDLDRNNIIQESLEGKFLLVGKGADNTSPDYFTPMAANDRALTRLELQSQALNTLANHRQPRDTGPLGHLATSILSLALTLCGLAMFEKRRVVVLTGAAVLLVLAASATFVWVGIRSPIAAFLTPMATMAVATACERAKAALRMAKHINDRARAYLKNRPLIACKEDKNRHCQLFLALCEQLIDVTRSALLQVQESGKRVEVFTTFKCTPQDIEERRVEITRSPYADAVRGKEPLRVKRFLKNQHEQEEQFVLPLTSGNVLAGFWVVGVEKRATAKRNELFAALQEIAGVLGQALHDARKQKRNAAARASASGTAEHALVKQSVVMELKQNFERLTTALEASEVAFRDSEAALLAYDSYGRLLTANQEALEWFARHRLPPFEKTALDVLVLMTDIDVTSARNAIRHAMLQGKKRDLGLLRNGAGQAGNRVIVRPIHPAVGRGKTHSESGNSGPRLLLEVRRVDAGGGGDRIQAKLVDRMSLRFRSALSTIALARSVQARVCADGTLHDDETEITSAELQECMEAVKRCQAFQSSNGDGCRSWEVPQPVDIAEALASCLQGIQEKFSRNYITVQTKWAETRPLVLCSPAALKLVLEHFLSKCLEAAREHSQLCCTTFEEDKVVVLELLVEGPGLVNTTGSSQPEGSRGALPAEGDLDRALGEMGARVRTKSILGAGLKVTLEMDVYL